MRIYWPSALIGSALGALAGLSLAACGSTAPTTTTPSVAGATTTIAPTTTTTTTSGMGGMSSSGMGGTNSLPKTDAKVSAVALTGSIAAPVVTVTGSGFGTRPAPYPATTPEGQSGCPSAPAVGDGFLYANRLFFKDPDNNTGFIAGEDAGGQFDCVGIVIDSWSPTKVAFGFGNLYDKQIPQNYYVLSKGDLCTVYVQGAAGSVRVSLPG